MGPPCEHGGKAVKGNADDPVILLQWGRRVNTAESSERSSRARRTLSALQWGRRVNTAESYLLISYARPRTRLQWGRRVNTAESTLTSPPCVVRKSNFNGAAV